MQPWQRDAEFSEIRNFFENSFNNNYPENFYFCIGHNFFKDAGKITIAFLSFGYESQIVYSSKEVKILLLKKNIICPSKIRDKRIASRGWSGENDEFLTRNAVYREQPSRNVSEFWECRVRKRKTGRAKLGEREQKSASNAVAKGRLFEREGFTRQGEPL